MLRATASSSAGIVAITCVHDLLDGRARCLLSIDVFRPVDVCCEGFVRVRCSSERVPRNSVCVEIDLLGGERERRDEGRGRGEALDS